MPNILCFDTATTACTVSLVYGNGSNGGQVSRHKEESNIHSTALLRMIDEVLSEACIELSDIDVLGVGIGPGSFTGLRIGIGVAQGLAYTHNIDIAAVSTLEIVALNALESGNSSGLITVGLDARMSEIYTATFRSTEAGKGSKRLSYESPDQVLSPELFCDENTFDRNRLYTGNAWRAYQSIFDEKGFVINSVDVEESQGGDSGFPNSALFAQYLANHLEEFNLLNWSELSAKYVRNDVAKKAGGK